MQEAEQATAMPERGFMLFANTFSEKVAARLRATMLSHDEQHPFLQRYNTASEMFERVDVRDGEPPKGKKFKGTITLVRPEKPLVNAVVPVQTEAAALPEEVQQTHLLKPQEKPLQPTVIHRTAPAVMVSRRPKSARTPLLVPPGNILQVREGIHVPRPGALRVYVACLPVCETRLWVFNLSKLHNARNDLHRLLIAESTETK